MNETEKNLEKFVESELQVMSPLLAKSLKMLSKASDIIVKDKYTLSEAKRQKKEAVEYRGSVIDMRKAFTRKLDGLKASFIEKQDEVLAPSIKAEGILKERINEYENEQRRLKEVEEARVQKIIDSVQMPKVDRKTITEDEAIRLKVDFDMTVNTIEKKDRNKKAVKEQIVATKSLYEELLTHVRTRDEQIATAVALEKERQELDARQRDLQAAHDAVEAAETLKAYEVAEGKPIIGGNKGFAAASPVDNSVDHAAGFSSPYYLVQQYGAACMAEAMTVLGDCMNDIKDRDMDLPSFAVWKEETVDAIYQVIAKHQ